MDKIDKIIEILEKQLLNIQMVQKKTTRYYTAGFKRAVYIIKKIKEELDEGLKMEDKKLVCKDCGITFTFKVKDQEFYRDMGFKTEPKRCLECRKIHKQRIKNMV